MFIELRLHAGDKYKFVRAIREDTMPGDGKLYVPAAQITNFTQPLKRGGTYWDLLPVYSTYDPACILKVSDNNYEIVFKLNKVKKHKKRSLEAQTSRYIMSDSPNEKRLPAWRQNKMRDFVRMYEKKQSGTILSESEQEEYVSLINLRKKRTAVFVYNRAIKAYRWMRKCYVAHDNMEAKIDALTDISDALHFNESQCQYPPWGV